MKIQGNPGPTRITVTFEEGEFNGKSVTMDAEHLYRGTGLYASSIRKWDDGEVISAEIKSEIVQLIKDKLAGSRSTIYE